MKCILRPRIASFLEDPDFRQHYDIDGVSFQRGFGVIIASDARIEFRLPLEKSKGFLFPVSGRNSSLEDLGLLAAL
jgi:hypothetical protein